MAELPPLLAPAAMADQVPMEPAAAGVVLVRQEAVAGTAARDSL